MMITSTLLLLLALNPIRVPADFPTIEEAISAAESGATILVASGVYQENLVIRGKDLILQSEGAAILDGDGETVLTIDDVGPGTRIEGFIVRNGDDGISTSSEIQILRNRFVGNGDAIDYEGGGGICRLNTFENNKDDAIDLDGSSAVIIEGNTLIDNEDDGIEIRLHPYEGETLEIVIRNNLIQGSGEDGIQFIDYGTNSYRRFWIERNLIVDSEMAAIGCMGNETTRENYEAFLIPEPIYVVNNSMVNNHFGVTGGANMVLLNNLLVGSRGSALKGVKGSSISAHNLFWDNGRDIEDSSCDEGSTILSVDPLLDGGYALKEGSLAVDRGVDSYVIDGVDILKEQLSGFLGEGPDLGCFEVVPD